MVLQKVSAFVKITREDIARITELVKALNPTTKEAYWLKLKNRDAVFYEISFETIDIEQFKKACAVIAKNAEVELLTIEFKNSNDCLELLQDKGFSKYENEEYVDFRHDPKNVRVVLIKEKDYVLKIERLDDTEPYNMAYFFSLANRVFEIIK